MPNLHVLKLWPFQHMAIQAGIKRADIRLDDQGYQTGDFVVFRFYTPTREEWGQQYDVAAFPYANEGFGEPGYNLNFAPLFCRITDITRGFGLQDGYVCLSFALKVLTDA